jgi:hypothetical protein
MPDSDAFFVPQGMTIGRPGCSNAPIRDRSNPKRTRPPAWPPCACTMSGEAAAGDAAWGAAVATGSTAGGRRGGSNPHGIGRGGCRYGLSPLERLGLFHRQNARSPHRTCAQARDQAANPAQQCEHDENPSEGHRLLMSVPHAHPP